MNPLRHLATLATTCALAALSTPAPAALLTASYSGTVSGYTYRPQVLTDFPVGTAVSWEFTFDDAFRSLNASGDVFGTAAQAISGWAQVGADRVSLDQFGFFSYQFDPSDNSIVSYRAHVRGTGPGISGGGEFFGLFITMDALLTGQDSAAVGYGYSSGSGTAYGYLTLEGNGRIAPPSQVPVPGTAWLVLPALAGLAWRRRGLGA